MKLFIIPVLLGFLLFVLYSQSMEKENRNIYTGSKSTEKYIKLIENNEVFTSNNEEEIDRKVKSIEALTVDIGMDINTTRDKEVILTAYVKNIEEDEGCNYFWRDGKIFLGIGDSIIVKFKKGKHIISLYAQTTNGVEGNATKVVTAWEYTKEATLYFDEKTGEFTHKRVRTYDYRGNLIQIKGRNFLKTYVYDKNGQEIEMHYDNYSDIEYSRSSSSEYDENGNMIKNESLDADGKVVWSEIGEYNEENETISYLMGENEEDLEEIMEDDEEIIEDELIEDQEEVEENKEDKYVYDENDNLLQSEYSYGTMTVSSKMTYNEYNQTLTEHQMTKDVNYTYGTDYIYAYDNDGNIASLEKKEYENGKIVCHYVTSSTYNKKGYVLKEVNKVLSGNCVDYVYDLYVENTYDKEGNIIDVKSKTYTKENLKEMEDEISEMHRTMKTKKYYSNDLDD
jgi:hypothetical protein